MWRMEEVLREEGIVGENGKSEKGSSGLPPGFRFHPTDEELIRFYLASKVFNNHTTNFFLSSPPHSALPILEVDLTRCEPWDLPERAKMGEREWYLYSLRDRKYPSGLRTNRATESGYWKATGKDRQVYATGININNTAARGADCRAGGVVIGMKKTLVFYQGRAPRGLKTRWVMHEYRLDGHFSSFRLSSKEEWVICRIFQKNGEKKLSSPIIHPLSPSSPPPPLPLPPLSPFLTSLPPLQDPNTTTQTPPRPLPYYANNHDLLHSLLLNPLPNFSSISGSDTIFPHLNATTATTATSMLFKSYNSSSTTNTAATATATGAAVTKECQKPHHWLDKICPQIDHSHEFDEHHYHQYHDHNHHHLLNYENEMDCLVPSSTTIDNDDGNGGHDHHHHHVDMSHSSIAVAALDRILNHTINHPSSAVAAAQSWTFHP